MSEATHRVQQTARDARSNDDLIGEDFEIAWDENDIAYLVDEETLDERASTQMGDMWEPKRRDAN